MNKSELRKATIDQLKKLTPQAKTAVEKQLTNRLVESDDWKAANTIGLTISMDIEWNTKPIIEKAWNSGKRVAVPKCLPNKQMAFFQLDHFNQLEKGLHDIWEPNPDRTEKLEKEELDLLLVPGVVYDRHGYRIGFGGGYYDRFLAGFSNSTLSIASNLQVMEVVPVQPFDIPVQCLMTEDQTYRNT